MQPRVFGPQRRQALRDGGIRRFGDVVVTKEGVGVLCCSPGCIRRNMSFAAATFPLVFLGRLDDVVVVIGNPVADGE